MPIQVSTLKYVILTNFGNDSIALTQWAKNAKLTASELKVVYLDTGFAAASWQARIEQGKKHIETCGFETIHLHSKISFPEAILGRNAFPDFKFQWCSTLLKGLPLLDWLDSLDPQCRTTLLLAKRKETLPLSAESLSERMEKVDYYHDRSVWHPLWQISEKERNVLLKQAGFEPLPHRSLECDPCVNSSLETLAALSLEDIQKVETLEEKIGMAMFQNAEYRGKKNIRDMVRYAKKITQNKKNRDLGLELFYRGCGNPFACGV